MLRGLVLGSLVLSLAFGPAFAESNAPAPATSLPPNGAASGYLSGTYPGPVVNKVKGTTTNDNATAGDVGEFVTAIANTNQATVTVTIATPGVVTYTSNGFSTTTPTTFSLTTTGALPTGLVGGTTYYTIPSTVTANTFQLATTLANAYAGTAIATSGTQSGVHTGFNLAQLATGTPQNILGLNLTAGDWWVCSIGVFSGGSTTTVTYLATGHTTVSATLPSNPVDAQAVLWGAGGTVFNSTLGRFAVPCRRFSLAATTLVYMVSQAVFATSTANAAGSMSALRTR